MSKNMTRKGLAFGAMVALSATSFVALPAAADTTGPITLVPNAGTTFNSILQSGIVLKSEIDPIYVADDAELTFKIVNAGLAKLTLTYDGSAVNTDLKQNVVTSATELVNGSTGPNWAAAGGLTSANATDLVNPYIYVSGSASNASGSAGVNLLTITSTETTKNVTFTVQAFLDSDKDGFRDTFEPSSDVETVILYAAGNVSATTVIDRLVVGDDSFKATVTYGNNVNPHMVAARTSVMLLKDGATVNGSANTTSDVFPVTIGAANQAGSAGYTKNTLVAGVTASNGNYVADGADLAANVAAGIWSAVAYYDTKASSNLDSLTDMVRMGAPSVVEDLTAGGNADVDGISPVYTTNANQKSTATDANEIYVRTGTKTVTFGAQITKSTLTPTTLRAANVPVRVVVSDVALDAKTEITVTGASGKLVDGGAAIIAYARTDSNGRVSFTLTSTTGEADDAVDLSIQYKNNSGVWVASGVPTAGVDVKWFDTAYDSLGVSPAAYVSGANPTVTFTVRDQWSQPVSFIDDTRLSVYASAYIGGVEKVTTYAERVTVVDGKAAFTFKNFATAGATAELRAILYKGATTSVATKSVIVYSGTNTASITIANSFKTDITYTDYVTGDETVAAVADKLKATGLDVDTVRATITGNVLSASGSGQPGSAVKLSADGVLFYDSVQGIYAENTITTYANEFGAFSVFAYAHKVNTAGATVSVEADGIKTSTKLVTYLPKDVLNANNLQFTWDLPATLVKNTTYALTATLTDKWGNPVATSGAGSVEFQGTGSVEVNGVATTVARNFDANGKALVFIRSVKDIAGPGSITATLKQVASQYKIDPTVDETAGNGSLGADRFGSLTAVATDVAATAWDETKFRDTLTTVVDIKDVAPVTGKVNVGSFNGKLVVYASGLNGARISWKVGGNWGSAVATSNYSIFNRPTPRAGVTVTVEVFVNGVKQLTKSVVTR